MGLAAELLADGFVTSGDPLLVSQPELSAKFTFAWNGSEMPMLQAQSVGYAKGQARALTLLTILSILIQDEIDAAKLNQVQPHIFILFLLFSNGLLHFQWNSSFPMVS